MSSVHSIVFLGTPDFAVPSLEALVKDSAFSVDLVITQPDKPVGRSQKLTPPPVKTCALAYGIEVIQPENINIDGLPLKPDFLVVVAYGQILKKPILDAAQTASVNIHPSLLPRWRGASPLQHAILHGDTETGVTIQMMTEKLDAGDILSQTVVPLSASITAPVLHDLLSQLGATLLVDTLKSPLKPTPQNDDEVTMCSKLSREDGNVTTETMTAEEIDRHVRALVPWPGVRMSVKGTDLKILKTSLTPTDVSIAVPCAQGTTLYLVQVQPEGKKSMSAVEWSRGLR